MNGRWAAGLAAFFSVGSLVWLPYGAKAGQTMIGQTTATGVASDLNSRAGANGANARNRAVGVLSGKGFIPVPEENSQAAPAPAPASPQRSIVDPREIAARLADPSRLEEIQGSEFGLTGTIRRFMDLEGELVILLSPHQATGLPAEMVLMVKMLPMDRSTLGVGQQAMLTGRLVSSKLNESGAVETLAFDQGQIMRTGGAPQGQPQAQAPVEADPMRGWELAGFAHMRTGGTCVFVKEGAAVYLHPGDEIEKGLRVTAVSPDGVELSIEGKKVELYAG